MHRHRDNINKELSSFVIFAPIYSSACDNLGFLVDSIFPPLLFSFSS